MTGSGSGCAAAGVWLALHASHCARNAASVGQLVASNARRAAAMAACASAGDASGA